MWGGALFFDISLAPALLGNLVNVTSKLAIDPTAMTAVSLVYLAAQAKIGEVSSDPQHTPETPGDRAPSFSSSFILKFLHWPKVFRVFPEEGWVSMGFDNSVTECYAYQSKKAANRSTPGLGLQ
ncbi:hypothetical protein C8J56DRAFT_894836 [Mycena floridula]|nr:hypothetical protein C8J56DRAFT_894836 [Mycena floridula]